MPGVKQGELLFGCEIERCSGDDLQGLYDLDRLTSRIPAAGIDRGARCSRQGLGLATHEVDVGLSSLLHDYVIRSAITHIDLLLVVRRRSASAWVWC